MDLSSSSDQPSSDSRPFDADASERTVAQSPETAERAGSAPSRHAEPGGRSPKSLAVRVSPDSVYAEMSDEERYIICSSLGRLVEQTLRSGRAVFLEGLGIVFPNTTASFRSYTVEEKLAVRRESVTTVDFEKCAEILAMHREKFGSIMETRELSSRLYPSLPLLLQLRWSPDDLKRRLQGLVRAIRSEIVTNGVSRRLDKVGTFYVLHNRHGTTPEDWFAGADIFLSSPHRWIREVEQSALFERPVLQSSWELFSAAFGREVGHLDVDVAKELAAVHGFQAPKLPVELRQLSIRVFQVTSSPSKIGETTLLFCTDGVRRLAIGPDRRGSPRCELTFQLSFESAATTVSAAQIPSWPKRVFALAAAIVAHQLLGRDSAWVGMSVPMVDRSPTRLEAVLLQRLTTVANEQLSAEGEFSYVNVIGITGDELALAEELGLSHLIALLRRKGLDIVTKLHRTSVIARTTINTGTTAPRVLSRGGAPQAFGAVQ